MVTRFFNYVTSNNNYKYLNLLNDNWILRSHEIVMAWQGC